MEGADTRPLLTEVTAEQAMPESNGDEQTSESQFNQLETRVNVAQDSLDGPIVAQHHQSLVSRDSQETYNGQRISQALEQDGELIKIGTGSIDAYDYQ